MQARGLGGEWVRAWARCSWGMAWASYLLRYGITIALALRWGGVLAARVFVLDVLRHGVPLPGWFRP